MRTVASLLALMTVALLVAACQAPAYDSAHPDARNSGPFWEREEQRD